MTAIAPDILVRLPHREPFRFISRLERIVNGREGEAVWTVTGDEAFFEGHFPGEPLVPGVLLSEALAQVAGLVCFAHAAADHGIETPAGRLAQIDMRFDRSVAPPAEVRLFVNRTRCMGHLNQCDVRAEVDGKVVARGSLVLARADHAAGSADEGET